MKNLSKIISVLVLALYLSPLILSVGTLTMYFSNLDYIQNELCVNRDSSELKCEGSCVLAQMMAETKSQSSQNQSSLEIEVIHLVLGFNNSNAKILDFSAVTEKIFRNGVNENYSLILTGTILDPPELLA